MLQQANVVIGTVCYQGCKPYGRDDAIRAYLLARPQRPPDFHAWIQTPGGGIYDYTLGQTWAERLPQFEFAVIREQDAQCIGLAYTAVLTAKDDVVAFRDAVKRAFSMGLG